MQQGSSSVAAEVWLLKAPRGSCHLKHMVAAAAVGSKSHTSSGGSPSLKGGGPNWERLDGTPSPGRPTNQTRPGAYRTRPTETARRPETCSGFGIKRSFLYPASVFTKTFL